MTMPETHPSPRQTPNAPAATAARKFDRLTTDEARRALYIDFEGGKDNHPSCSGRCASDGRSPEPIVHQVVVDPTFTQAGPEAGASSKRSRRSSTEPSATTDGSWPGRSTS